MLQADGSLRAGVAGSFDASGYRMELTATGAPRFVPAQAGCGTADWDAQFGLNGTNGEVDALAVMGNAIYVGGDFTFAGNVAANNVAKFDTTTNTWSALSQGNGNGVNFFVFALAVSGNSLFVGGNFGMANQGGTGATPAIPASGVAKFDTMANTWSALSQGNGNGVGAATALAVSGNSLFVGDGFSTVNQGGTGATPAIAASGVAKFDTIANTWSALSQGNSNGVNNDVRALAVIGNTIYVGGVFTAAGNVVANNVAKFDTTTNTWSALSQGNGNGVDNYVVWALAVSGNSLFVGGFFTTANQGGTGATPAIPANNVAKFDTTANTWSALSQGNGNGVNVAVNALAVSGNSLFVGGGFTTANQGGTGATPAIPANRVAKFDTTTNTWSALSQGNGNGVNFFVLALAVSGNSLFVGGNFAMANQGGTGATPAIPASGVAKFDTMANTWSALSQGNGNGVGAATALAVSGNSLFVGDGFSTVNQGGTGATPEIRANRVAKFDTMANTWSALSQGNSNGVDNDVRALAVIGNAIYIGGVFTFAGNVAANNVAKFDTTTNTWSALSQGNGNGVNGNFVDKLAVSGNSLFVGGGFTVANQGGTGATPAIPANNVAKFDTTTNTWSALSQGNGNGVNNTVRALAVSGNSLFVGGFFTTANQGGTGGTPAIVANRVARFDITTNTWSALSQGNGNGVSSAVRALAVSGNSLFVGGFFTTANLGGTGATPAIPANLVAKFDTTTNIWSALSQGNGNGVDPGVTNGLDHQVSALAVSGNSLFLGGFFMTANQGGTGATPAIPANNVAKFDTTTNTWSALSQGDGNGVDNQVRELAVSGNSLFLGGTFTTANLGGTGATPAITANRVAKFDTMANIWSALAGSGGGNGVNVDNGNNDLAVDALAVKDCDLFVGGDFLIADNKVSQNIARYGGGGAALPPVFASAVSRKVHGSAGTFDLPLSAVTTNPTTEPRQGPAQTIVLTFNKAITGATVAITEGTATAGAPTFSGNDVVVGLTGVNNQQYVTISLTNVASADGGTGGSGSVRVGFLLGDVNQNRVVTVADLGLVNQQLAQVVTAANYLKDVNASGTLTVADKGITNANLTKALPAP